jgi:hypothetical protein
MEERLGGRDPFRCDNTNVFEMVGKDKFIELSTAFYTKGMYLYGNDDSKCTTLTTKPYVQCSSTALLTSMKPYKTSMRCDSFFQFDLLLLLLSS